MCEETTNALTLFSDEQTSIDELLQDAQGVQLNFEKIKVPTAGNIAFTILDPATGEEEPKKALRGVILAAKPSNVYFENPYTGEAVQPNCSSRDGVVGINEMGEEFKCADCPFNQFGSGKDGRGKACQNRMNLYILLDGEFVPRLMSLPASAIANFNAFRTQLIMGKKPLKSVYVVIKLEKKKSNSGVDYSCPTFAIDGKVMDSTPERLEELASAWSLLKCAQIVQ